MSRLRELKDKCLAFSVMSLLLYLNKIGRQSNNIMQTKFGQKAQKKVKTVMSCQIHDHIRKCSRTWTNKAMYHVLYICFQITLRNDFRVGLNVSKWIGWFHRIFGKISWNCRFYKMNFQCVHLTKYFLISVNFQRTAQIHFPFSWDRVIWFDEIFMFLNLAFFSKFCLLPKKRLLYNPSSVKSPCVRSQSDTKTFFCIFLQIVPQKIAYF